MIPFFNPNFYKDIYSASFAYEPCKLDYWQRFKMPKSQETLEHKICEAFVRAINEIEWVIRYAVSVVIYPMLDYEARNKCEYINNLSNRAIHEFSEFIYRPEVQAT